MQIEKNIPIPEIEGRGRPREYPFYDMEVGDSVFFDGETLPCKQYVAAKIAGSKTGKTFSGRTVDGGVRIWRTA